MTPSGLNQQHLCSDTCRRESVKITERTGSNSPAEEESADHSGFSVLATSQLESNIFTLYENLLHSVSGLFFWFSWK